MYIRTYYSPLVAALCTTTKTTQTKSRGDAVQAHRNESSSLWYLDLLPTMHYTDVSMQSFIPVVLYIGGQLGSTHNTMHLVHCFMYFRLLRSPPKILSSMEQLMGNQFENLPFQFISTHIIINCGFILINNVTIVGRLLDTFQCVLIFSSNTICVLTIYKS